MTSKIDTQLARVFAIIIAFILLLRIYLATQTYGSILSGISYLPQFFTILTSTLVMLMFLYLGYCKNKSIKFLEPLVVAAMGVGIVYHLLLAHLWNPTGLTWLADQGVHTVMPLLAFFWWMFFREVRVVPWKITLVSILWPLIYSIYALIRAEFTNFYPYPFLNLETLGWSKLFLNITMLTLAFFVLGVLLALVSRIGILKKR